MYEQYGKFLEKYSADGFLSWSLSEDGLDKLKWIRDDGWYLFIGSLVPIKLNDLSELLHHKIDIALLEDQLRSSCIQEVLFASLVLEAGTRMFGPEQVDLFLDVFKKHNNKSKLRLISPKEEPDE